MNIEGCFSDLHYFYYHTGVIIPGFHPGGLIIMQISQLCKLANYAN